MSDALTPSFEPVHTIPGSSLTLEHEVGTIFCLSLREIASAGFVWRLDHIPPFLRLVNRARPRAAPPPDDARDLAVGSAGLRELRFMVLAAGSGRIELTLRQPWMGDLEPPAESASVHVACRTPELATRPLALGVHALEIPPAAMQLLAGFAASGQWSAYAEAARAAGSWLPTEAPAPQDVVFRGWGLWDPVRQAVRQSGMAPSELLASARAVLGAEDFAALTQELLDREVVEQGPDAFLAALLAAGTDPLAAVSSGFCPAAHAVVLADLRTVKTFLEHGLDPNSRAPTPAGPTSLILLALEKDRLVSMSEKMACARALFDAGARLPAAFAGHAGPTSMLEMLLASEGLFDPSMGDNPLYKRNYSFSFNYFDEAGIPPSELLPVPSDEAGRARILRLLSEPDCEDEAFDPRPPVRGSGWRLRCKSYPWLAAAIETLELGAAARLDPPRGTSRSL